MQHKTPGVDIAEKNALFNTVVAVATAVPVFLGYTEKAADGPGARQGIPTCIGSMADYVRIFGQPCAPSFTLTASTDKKFYVVAQDQAKRFFLYNSMALYFLNGGGPAYVMSIGSYAKAVANGKSMADFVAAPDPGNPALQAPFDTLKKVLDVTLIVAPDTTLLGTADDCYAVWVQALAHCGDMQSRMALIDIYDGDQARTHDAEHDIISGNVDGLREKIGTNFLNYGTAYYPWVNFNVVDENSLTFDNLDDTSLAVLVAALNDEMKSMNPPPTASMQSTMTALYGAIKARLAPDCADLAANSACRADQIKRHHAQLKQVSPVYERIAADMLKHANLLPPCAAMAGVYAQTDANEGVSRAPANKNIAMAVSAALEISQEDQQDLNAPLDGKAVNAIRTIPGRDLVVWGARTLDGNSSDWRYVNVRRTMIMLEQSIKAAVMTYASAPNVASTWVAVQSMIANFLINQWQEGVLAGAKPEDAFSVMVGLGTTMTGDDILDGIMRVSVQVAIVHPAEFIVVTFQQQMQVC